MLAINVYTKSLSRIIKWIFSPRIIICILCIIDYKLHINAIKFSCVEIFLTANNSDSPTVKKVYSFWGWQVDGEWTNNPDTCLI